MGFREAARDLPGPLTLVFVTTIDPATADVVTKVYEPSPDMLALVQIFLGEPVAEALGNAEHIDSIPYGKPADHDCQAGTMTANQGLRLVCAEILDGLGMATLVTGSPSVAAAFRSIRQRRGADMLRWAERFEYGDPVPADEHEARENERLRRRVVGLEAVTENLAARHFDEEEAPGLRQDGMPEEGIAHLRRQYIVDAIANETAVQQLHEMYKKAAEL